MTLDEWGLSIGQLPSGALGSICDVPGVTVGHYTLDTQRFHTGVTVIQPSPDNVFLHKLPAGVCQFNGFGKTAGLMQLQELGRLETPIALTGTLNVGKVLDGLVGYVIDRCVQDGFPDVRSINAVVAECNDGTLSDIRARPVDALMVHAALAHASTQVEEGCVGAGTGTICHGLKGGIGTASRRLEVDGNTYHLGVLTQTNHGSLEDLTIGGRAVGKELARKLDAHKPDKGSVIVVAATDLPLSSRQLSRVAKRCSVGLARLGSYIGQGSGEVFLAFSTANPYHVLEKKAVEAVRLFREDALDLPFRAAAECTEEAVLRSMLAAHTVTGWQGDKIFSLSQVWEGKSLLQFP